MCVKGWVIVIKLFYIWLLLLFQLLKLSLFYVTCKAASSNNFRRIVLLISLANSKWLIPQQGVNFYISFYMLLTTTNSFIYDYIYPKTMKFAVICSVIEIAHNSNSLHIFVFGVSAVHFAIYLMGLSSMMLIWAAEARCKWRAHLRNSMPW